MTRAVMYPSREQRAIEQLVPWLQRRTTAPSTREIREYLGLSVPETLVLLSKLAARGALTPLR